MRLFLFIFICATSVALGQQTNQTDSIESLRAQLRQMQEEFERTQRQHQAAIEALTRKLDALANSPSTAPAKPDEQKQLEEQLARELGPTSTNTPPQQTPATKWSPSQSIPVFRAGSAYMNVSFDTLIDAGWSTEPDPSAQLQLGDHDPIKRGFSLRNAEIALDGAVDPYFKGFANLVFKLDKDNETDVELEEAYFLSTGLPANLQLKGGQFFADFGRQNSQHAHRWDFVDQPLILNRTFGPDGLRSIGAQLSWLAPTKFYTEFTLGVLDGQGGTAFSFRNPGEPDENGIDRVHGRSTLDRNLRGPQDLVYTPRVASSFELSDTQTLLVGASGAFGPNDTGPHNRTEIYGTDIYWKWKSPNARAGFPFVSWQTEALLQRFGAGPDGTAGLPGENLWDYGFYSQLLWGFRPRWVSGLRGEYVAGNQGAFDNNDVFRGRRYRLSPVLSWYPSEFSKLRLQYNYDHGQLFADEHSVWIQAEFLLGAHGAHKF